MPYFRIIGPEFLELRLSQKIDILLRKVGKIFIDRSDQSYIHVSNLCYGEIEHTQGWAFDGISKTNHIAVLPSTHYRNPYKDMLTYCERVK